MSRVEGGDLSPVRLDRGVTSRLVDLAALRAFLVAHAVPGLDVLQALPDGSSRHHRMVRAGGHDVVLAAVLPAGAVGTPALEVQGEADAVPAALATGHRWVGLDADPGRAVRALAHDPVLGPLVRARPHLRVPGSTGAFETAVLVVLGQHVSLAAGRRFAARLVEAHAVQAPEDPAAGRRHDPAPAPPLRLSRFPAPEVLAALDPVELQRTVGVTSARARTVVGLARAVADGILTLDHSAEVREALLAIPGIGPWTADLVRLRALRDPDVFLPGDLVLRRALGGAPAARAAALAEAWRPHRSLAVLHLWTAHAIDPRP